MSTECCGNTSPSVRVAQHAHDGVEIHALILEELSGGGPALDIGHDDPDRDVGCLRPVRTGSSFDHAFHRLTSTLLSSKWLLPAENVRHVSWPEPCIENPEPDPVENIQAGQLGGGRRLDQALHYESSSEVAQAKPEHE